MQHAKLTTLVACLCIAGASIGCGASVTDADTPATVELGPKERVLQFRTTLRELRDAPFAKEAAPDLDMAESWLADVDAGLRAEAPKQDHVELLLEAVRGQLVKVRSFYGRRESESALEDLRRDFQEHKERIQELRNSEETK